MDELIFEVLQEADGGFCAECLTENIFSQGDSWDELRRNVLEAVTGYFFDKSVPARIRLHLVCDEVLSVASASFAHLSLYPSSRAKQKNVSREAILDTL